MNFNKDDGKNTIFYFYQNKDVLDLIYHHPYGSVSTMYGPAEVFAGRPIKASSLKVSYTIEPSILDRGNLYLSDGDFETAVREIIKEINGFKFVNCVPYAIVPVGVIKSRLTGRPEMMFIIRGYFQSL